MANELSLDLPVVEAEAEEGKRERPRQAARVVYGTREQIEMMSLEDVIAPDHRVRLIWMFVERLDLSAWYREIEAVEGGPGRGAIDPRILVALWLYATVDGVGSARRLAVLCVEQAPYRWLAGGLAINYHTLSDFRTAHVEELDTLLTESAAALMAEGLVELKRVAQDGMRVRASAGAASFHREATLERCRRQACEQVEALRAEVNGDAAGASRRERAARERVAREREERLSAALEHVKARGAKKPAAERENTRASSTDPEARVMKMGDGGFRPAFNVQLATTVDTQVIVGVEVVNIGSDLGQMPPMIEQIEGRYEKVPDEYLVDGGFARTEDIEDCATEGILVYAPVMKPKSSKRAAHEARPDDPPGVAQWRARMETDPAKEIYKDRAATAECVNAIARNRGLRQFLVRGVRKVRAVILWYALAHNLMRSHALRQATLAAAA